MSSSSALWKRITAGCSDRQFSVTSPINTKRIPEQYPKNGSWASRDLSLLLFLFLLSPLTYTHLHARYHHTWRETSRKLRACPFWTVPRWLEILGRENPRNPSCTSAPDTSILRRKIVATAPVIHCTANDHSSWRASETRNCQLILWLNWSIETCL